MLVLVTGYGTRMFITVFRTACQLSLTSARWIHFMFSQEYQPRFKLDVPLPDCRQETPLLSLSLPTESETRPLTVWAPVVTLRTTMSVIKKLYLMARVHAYVMIVRVNSMLCSVWHSKWPEHVACPYIEDVTYWYIMNHHMHIYKYVLTYLLHGAETFLRSKPVFS